MMLHIIEGAAGCRYAVERGAAAVVVDALRASATAAALLAAGAWEILATRTVPEAYALKGRYPDALLYGERGGTPPPGFDYGNSPDDAVHGRDRRVIFTTTTGAGRLVEAWGTTPLLMGSTVNASCVVQYLLEAAPDEIVLIPAGLMDVPAFDALEDWVAASCLAMRLCDRAEIRWGAGESRFDELRDRIGSQGIEALFNAAPHADKLRAIGMAVDIARCAQRDIFNAVPVVVKKDVSYVVVRDACAATQHTHGQQEGLDE